MWLTKRKLLFCLSQASLTTVTLLLYHFTQPLPCWLPGERSRSTETAGRCLLQQGLEESGYLASDKVFSHFACPLGGQRYPRNLCTISPVFLNHSARSFVARAQGAVVPRYNADLSSQLWPISATPSSWPNCSAYYDEAFLFSIDSLSSASLEQSYFTLHVDIFLPLFSLLNVRAHLGPPTRPGYRTVLMPAIEHYSLQELDWMTSEFDQQHKFNTLQQMTKAFGGRIDVVPLTDTSLQSGATTCIRTAHFGVGSVNCSDPALLQGFSELMKMQLGLNTLHSQQPVEPFVCLVRRSLSRRVLNEDALVNAVSKFVKIQAVHFDALSYAEQVAQMQQFTILVGFHGSELLNAIYMVEGSVAIQLMPFASSLDAQQYSQVLKAHGPYLEWVNQHEKDSRPSKLDDKDNRMADTVVNVEEFVQLVKEALQLGVNSRLVKMDDL